jgi:hypothetical protein
MIDRGSDTYIRKTDHTFLNGSRPLNLHTRQTEEVDKSIIAGFGKAVLWDQFEFLPYLFQALAGLQQWVFTECFEVIRHQNTLIESLLS